MHNSKACVNSKDFIIENICIKSMVNSYQRCKWKANMNKQQNLLWWCYVLLQATLTLLWSQKLDGAVHSTPIVYMSNLYVTTLAGSICILNKVRPLICESISISELFGQKHRYVPLYISGLKVLNLSGCL